MKKTEVIEHEAVNEAEVPVILKLNIPAELYATYKELADKQDLTVAELMLHRLNRCKGHSSIRSLYFASSHLVQLEGLLQKRPVESPEQALALLANALSFRVSDFPPIPISAAQAKRIYMGAYANQSAEQRLTAIVQRAVAAATGI